MTAEMREAEARLGSGRRGLARPLARIEVLGVTYVRFATSHPAHFRLMFGPELADRSPYPELAEAADASSGLLLDAVRDAQESGHVPLRRDPGPRPRRVVDRARPLDPGHRWPAGPRRAPPGRGVRPPGGGGPPARPRALRLRPDQRKVVAVPGRPAIQVTRAGARIASAREGEADGESAQPAEPDDVGHGPQPVDEEAAREGDRGHEHGPAGGGHGAVDRLPQVATRPTLPVDPVHEVDRVVHGDADRDAPDQDRGHVEGDPPPAHDPEGDRHGGQVGDHGQQPGAEIPQGEDQEPGGEGEGEEEGEDEAREQALEGRPQERDGSRAVDPRARGEGVPGPVGQRRENARVVEGVHHRDGDAQPPHLQGGVGDEGELLRGARLEEEDLLGGEGGLGGEPRPAGERLVGRGDELGEGDRRARVEARDLAGLAPHVGHRVEDVRGRRGRPVDRCRRGAPG